MALGVEVNPSDVEDAYLLGLNRSFGDWGGRSVYRWAFERDVGAGAPDLMVLRDHGTIVAGSAVSYRTVRYAAGQQLVGVMTGSWTLPEARGRGAFSEVIVESRRLLDARGGSALIAFVTHDNASRRRLVAAGCLEVPTWYVTSDPATPLPVDAPDVEADQAIVDDLFAAHLRWQAAGPGAFVEYPSVEAWASQYLDRPLLVECLTTAGTPCLIERAPTSDRILWIDGGDPSTVLAALLSRALTSDRQLFMFTMDAELAQAGVHLGMMSKPGSLCVLDPGETSSNGPRHRGVPTLWRMQGGDRA